MEHKGNPDKIKAADILKETIEVIKKRDSYGDAKQVFELARSLTFLYSRVSKNFDMPGHEEAIHMILHKLARIALGDFNRDHYIDICGYISLAAEIADEEEWKDFKAPE